MSVALVFQLTTIDQRLLLDRLGAVSLPLLEALREALTTIL